MFFFSSFFTGLPILIMAFMYMLYFGVYALNKPRDIENDIVPDIVQEFAEDLNETIGDDTFNYEDYYKSHQQTTYIAEPIIDFQEHFIISPHNIAEREPCSHCFPNKLYSRPPPVIC